MTCATTSTIAAKPVSVLLVEDIDSDAALFEAELRTAAPGAFEIARVTTLADATTYLGTKSPLCAVVDLDLADAEGVEIIHTLALQSPAVALIVLTGNEDELLGAATIQAGAVDHLSKNGLEGRLLARSIRHAILRKGFETSLAEAQSIARVGSWEVDLLTDTAIWSRELYRLYGFTPDEKPSYEALLDRAHPDDRSMCVRAFDKTVERHSPFVFEHRLLLPDGDLRWVRARGRVEVDESGEPERLVGTAQDITDQKSADDALIHQAMHDPLCGLPNRVLLLDRLGHALERLARQPSTVGVVYLDVDRFAVINDSLGHPVGDELLLAIAQRLTGVIRPGDTLARFGGDEFVVLCEGLGDESEAIGVAERIFAAMTEPLAWAGGHLVVSVSAGIALASSSEVDAESLLRDANAATHRAKRKGRGRSAVFAESMRAKAIGRLNTEISLRRSIEDGDLRVHFQPIISLVDGRVLGHEALARWAHPTRGLVGPEDFIEVAEETGLIVPLGAWVLRTACKQARTFQDRDPAWAGLTMSVNLSGAQLGQPDLVELVGSALADADLRPAQLQLEMTESVLMDDAANTITILRRLKQLGVRLGVDDFGTGFSSLAYLKRFPVDVLKIDRSFVDGLGRDLEDSAIVAAVVSLADTLGLATIAEGVETELQRESLVALGCTRAQGYLFAHPHPADAAERALDAVAAVVPHVRAESIADRPTEWPGDA